jgi:hypothetical protein
MAMAVQTSVSYGQVLYDPGTKTLKANGDVVIEDETGEHRADSETFKLQDGGAIPSCVQKLQAASHGPSCVFSESRMREICLSGSTSGNRKQSQAKPD